MLQGQRPICKLTASGSGCGGGRWTIEPPRGWTIEGSWRRPSLVRTPCEASRLTRYRGTEVGWNARPRMLENTAIVSAKVAAIVYRPAVGNVRIVVVRYDTAAPVWRPGVITPAVVSKQSNRDADGGKSDPETERYSEGWRSHIKACIG